MFISCGFIHYLVCRSGPLDTLIIFTTTISVSNMYSINIVFIVPIIWLYITVVVVVITFSIIVSCIFISLLLVAFGIVFSKMGSNSNVAISIWFDGDNISFDANLVMYINSTNIPPITIMNRIYENQNLLYIFPLIARKLSTKLYDIYHCCVYSKKLLVMDRGTVRNI